MVEFTAASANPSMTATALNMRHHVQDLWPLSGASSAQSGGPPPIVKSAICVPCCVPHFSRQSSSCRSPLQSLPKGRMFGQAGQPRAAQQTAHAELCLCRRDCSFGGRRLRHLWRSISESVLLPVQLRPKPKLRAAAVAVIAVIAVRS